MGRVRVKFCGLTQKADVQAAVRLGADAIGLVFYPPSPRAVTAAQAAELIRFAPPYVQLVGLFVDPTPDLIASTLGTVSLDVLQFHGQETPAACAALADKARKRWYKALAVRPDWDDEQLLTAVKSYQGAGACGVLLDTWHPALAGGSGESFDWQRFKKLAEKLPDFSLTLAGGLTAENIAQAIEQTQATAVDVSSGIELEKGIKSQDKMQAFMQAVSATSSRLNRT